MFTTVFDSLSLPLFAILAYTPTIILKTLLKFYSMLQKFEDIHVLERLE